MDAKEYFDILRDIDSRAEARAQALEQRIMDDRRESEKRIKNDRRESEKRLSDAVNRIEDRITSEMSELKSEFRNGGLSGLRWEQFLV